MAHYRGGAWVGADFLILLLSLGRGSVFSHRAACHPRLSPLLRLTSDPSIISQSRVQVCHDGKSIGAADAVKGRGGGWRWGGGGLRAGSHPPMLAASDVPTTYVPSMTRPKSVFKWLQKCLKMIIIVMMVVENCWTPNPLSRNCQTCLTWTASDFYYSRYLAWC